LELDTFAIIEVPNFSRIAISGRHALFLALTGLGVLNLVGRTKNSLAFARAGLSIPIMVVRAIRGR
jgi:hypothetical protein